MNPERISELIVQCGNAPFMLEVYQVRVNATGAGISGVAAGGMGAGGLMGPGGDRPGGGLSGAGLGGGGGGSDEGGYGGGMGPGGGGGDGDGYGGGYGGAGDRAVCLVDLEADMVAWAHGWHGGELGAVKTKTSPVEEVPVEIYGLVYLYNPPQDLSDVEITKEEMLRQLQQSRATENVNNQPNNNAQPGNEVAPPADASGAGEPNGASNPPAGPNTPVAPNAPEGTVVDPAGAAGGDATGGIAPPANSDPVPGGAGSAPGAGGIDPAAAVLTGGRWCKSWWAAPNPAELQIRAGQADQVNWLVIGESFWCSITKFAREKSIVEQGDQVRFAQIVFKNQNQNV